MPSVVLPFPENARLARAVASKIGARLGRLEWRHFPDGESLVTVDDELAGAEVVLFAGLDRPDGKLLPLRFAAQAARDMGARRVGLVAPYLGYMRQDHRFHAGEAISAPVFARMLEPGFDWLVTVDPHLHRIASLDEIFRVPATAVSSAPALAEWIRREVPRPLLIGPDGESAQWVADVARDAHAPYEVLHKTRRGDREVEVSLPQARHLQGYTPVLVDDIASTGRTLVAALEHLRRMELPPAVCVIIHGLFAGDAWEALTAAGAGRIVTTDSVPHDSNAIGLAAPIAEAVQCHLADRREEALR